MPSGVPSKKRVALLPEVKAQAIARVMRGEASRAEVARELGVNRCNITYWIRLELTRRGEGAPAQTPGGRSLSTVSAELEEALERVRELERELRTLLDGVSHGFDSPRASSKSQP